MIRRGSEPAFQQLAREIQAWELSPGEVLDPVVLALRLESSEAEVTEALGRLAAAGLVESRDGQGVVAGFDSENVVELFELREALEVQVARLVARRHDPQVFARLRRELSAAREACASAADGGFDVFYTVVDRFDEAMDDAVANPFLIGALAPIRAHLLRVRRVNPSASRFLQALAEQIGIVDAILDRDEVLAMQTTAVHLRASLTSLLGRMGVTDAWSQHRTGG